MNVYLISYDLRNHASFDNYRELIERIKSHGTWAKPLQSVWLVRTYLPLATVRDDLLGYISKNDALFVVDISSKSWGGYGLPNDVADWLRGHVAS